MARRKRMDDTRERIVGEAQALIQTRGYNGFSYRDIAAEIGIRSASIHHHFPRKADLGAAVARRFRETFMDALAAAEAEGQKPPALLARYVALFRSALSDGNRMCLCGILGAEIASLPGEVAAEAQAFLSVNTTWLARLVKRAKAEGNTDLRAPMAEARYFLATIEGAMILAKLAGDVGVFDEVARMALGRFGTSSKTGRT